MSTATIMISTKNRPDDLKNVLNRLRELCNYKEIEVIVTDDGSRENIGGLFREKYPEIIFRRSDISFNYLRHRNSMFRMAKSDYIFSIDDDAWYVNNDSIEKAIKIFRENPKAGVLNFKVKVPDSSKAPRNIAASAPFAAAEFIGCAHAIRKNCFAKEENLYDEMYFRQGEERDVAIRCLQKGYEILQVDDIAVFHNYNGAERDHQALHAYAFRNELFFYLKYFPGLTCPLLFAKCFVSHAFFCIRKHWFRAFFRGIYGFFKYFFSELKKRKPVNHRTAIKYLRLLRKNRKEQNK